MELFEKVRKQELGSLERIESFFVHLLDAEGNLFCYFWSDTLEMPPFPFRNKSLQAKVESWQRLEGVSKRHEVERFDTKREMTERLNQLVSVAVSQ